MKVYDFELEQTLEWSEKISNELDALVPNHLSSKKREMFKDKAFNKLESLKWGENRLCKKCHRRELQVGQKNYCIDCQRIASYNTEEALIYGT